MFRENVPSQLVNHEADIGHNHAPETPNNKPFEMAVCAGTISTAPATQNIELRGCRDVACQTDLISDFTLPNAPSSSPSKLENRSTQTEPATRSVFTRSSRFLLVSNENPSERQYSTASVTPSHRGDSTAVLSSGRGRGRFRGRGNNRVRLRRAVSLPNITTATTLNNNNNSNNQDQINLLNPEAVGRSASLFTSGGASTPNDILALLEARLGETPLQSSSTRSLQDPPAPPPVSPTEATPITRLQGVSVTPGATLSVQIMAQDADSLSTSDNLTILAPKSQQAVPVKPVPGFSPKRQQHHDFSTWTTEIDSMSERPPRVAPNANTSSVNSSLSPLPGRTSWGSTQTTSMPGTSLLMNFDGLNIVGSPEARNRRRGVRGFLSRLLGKEGSSRPKVPGATSSSRQARATNRTLRTFNTQQATTAGGGVSNSDSTG
ncbi:uncharacterized protein LOC111272492 [Varroa jacobsoni]|uniref:uncharacterized protein LOC111272492 n=1 Tax=Varroa jacobsoni TaxID=62625 RepID=UPI000BF5896B|nr:uncharacterized protein LOC111272492 [Varroa jacobsoni]XP_022709714.1 uncharacterized protein LOC111272492 [Varroa jacobsoni]XP_022709715.1 uncharacterized protein LOC111272492 [Varroa jacobsoni]XP_022709716.1 uncharacterized protein LOC111272492 [Varroa jacobsoni]XP_022709717.1 uncharacterized protein LOC111272492 [Varroa jacobsoni]XP_022709718.1 uncharacterized protein LOC111272492 [Varroa jacobsoni]XP_022709720.1 uncharacterized protein LOC111272492 [Varroa jacobsoni]